MIDVIKHLIYRASGVVINNLLGSDTFWTLKYLWENDHVSLPILDLKSLWVFFQA